MQKHHYLPASFLARFSTSENKGVREKVLSVGDKETGAIFKSSSGNTGCVANLYTMTWEIGQDKDFIEKLWQKYEESLSQAINKLIAGTIDGVTWARVLVPFVACMFVRGPDFNNRFKRRMNSLGVDEDYSNSDFTNQARMMEIQRLLGPVSAAKWIVINTIGGDNLITNDLGYAPFLNGITGERGVAIPLGLHHILAIVPQIERKVISIKEGKWVPEIEYTINFPGNHEDLNRTIVGVAQRFIFGSDNALLEKYLVKAQNKTLSPEPYELGFITDPLSRAHEFTWHRLVSAMEKEPSEVKNKGFPLDLAILNHGWMPVLYFPMNLIEFPPALEWTDDGINIKFYDPEFYYLLSRIVMLLKAKLIPEAIEECTTGMAQSYPPDKRCSLLLARAEAFDLQEKYDEAIQDLRLAIEIDTNNASAFSDLGVLLIKKGLLDDAVKALSKAIEINPNLSLPYLNRGGAYAKSGKFEEAIDDFSKCIYLVPSGPIRADACFNRGNAYSLLDRYDLAIKDYSEAIKNYENVDEKALSLYRRAAIFEAKNQSLRAIEDLKQAIQIKPNYFNAYLFMQALFKQIEKRDEAISIVNKALPLFADEKEKATLYFERGHLLSLNGEIEEGLKDFETANDLSPNNASTLFNIGVSYLFLARISEAINYYDQSLVLRPDYPDALNNRGSARTMLGEYQDALDDFKKAVLNFQENSGRASALRNMAVCLMLSKEYSLAEEAIDEASRFEPESPFLLQVKGQLAYYKEQYTEAYKYHKLAHKKLIPQKKKNYYFVLPLLHLNKEKEAMNLLRSFLDHNPSPLEVLRIKNELVRTKKKYPSLLAVDELLSQINIAGQDLT